LEDGKKGRRSLRGNKEFPQQELIGQSMQKEQETKKENSVSGKTFCLNAQKEAAHMSRGIYKGMVFLKKEKSIQ
jgi:hypothetical protein